MAPKNPEKFEKFWPKNGGVPDNPPPLENETFRRSGENRGVPNNPPSENETFWPVTRPDPRKIEKICGAAGAAMEKW